MTLQLVLLCSLYVGIGLLVLYLLIDARLPLVLRAILVVAVSASYFASWTLWRDVAGWPARAVLPERFLFLAASVTEPDDERAEPGSIYIWATALSDDGPQKKPRAYRLPYLKALHSQIQAAEARMRNGQPQVGRLLRSGPERLHATGIMERREEQQRIELDTLPSPALPEK